MNIVPQGKVQLYKNISLDPSYSKTFFFKNETEQDQFFSGSNQVANSVTPILTVNNVSYMREKRNTIRIESNTALLFNCNYMRFKNTDAVGNTFPNKWYYAFVLSAEYINNSTVEIVYEIDVMQTWLPKWVDQSNPLYPVTYNNDYTLGKCLVLRNHSMTDEIGDNIEPEDFGEDESTPINVEYSITNNGVTTYYNTSPIYVMDLYDETEVNNERVYNSKWYVVAMYKNGILASIEDWLAAKLSDNTSELYGAFAFSGVFQGAVFTAFEINQDTITSLNTLLMGAEVASLGIERLFMCPGFMIPKKKVYKLPSETDEEYEQRMETYYLDVNSNNTNNTILVFNSTPTLGDEVEYISIPDSFSGYEPINNKMFTYPYTYLYATNNRGQNRFYRYEFFKDKHGTFQVEGNFSSQPAMMLYPTNYKNQNNCYEEKLLIDTFPECSWNQNTLVDWLAKATMIGVAGSTGAGSTAFTGMNLITGSKTEANYKYKDENYDLSTPVGNIRGSRHGANSASKHSILTPYGFDDNGNILPPERKNTYASSTHSDRRNISRNIQIPTPWLSNVVGSANGDIMLGNKHLESFTIFPMQIVKQFAMKIDDFFSRYGYAINDVKEPIINARPKFTFVQTSGCCMRENNIPAEVEDIICKIYDKGITFWNDKSQVDNYGRALYLANKIPVLGGAQNG